MLELTDITKRYGAVTAVDRATLRVLSGEFVTVRGPSGCGKTTLLMIAGAMLSPTDGTVTMGDDDMYAMNTAARAALRATRVGFVFQMIHLVPYLTVIENVMLAAQTPAATRDRAKNLLKDLGLGERIMHKPHALSAGERQRAAVARALLNEPTIVLADEPTGNLDPESAASVFEALRRYRDSGGTVIAVTHGPSADGYADRTIHMRSGQIESQPQTGDTVRA